ncbi:MAG: thymidine kinase [Nanoarchaeota archaeon]|nr:thymidine kinase [Nanoarchaeota archaeon]MBU1445449.1 thymidine kinase [Nanoarchaeota archaeon]MBU2406979.1 thymidine kinase [Nanoarchaeota archaeon]MBU2420257.1 thymidine kinase [Nanoarchaeota archaeon]MBU2474980.1 thymidine kinase [Nanoarchaeota archaeon]
MSGIITVITGPMFSGKSKELARLLRRQAIAKRKVQIFKPAIDTRWDQDSLGTHDGSANLEGIPIFSVFSFRDILSCLVGDVNVVGIDEVQFLSDNFKGFDKEGVDIIQGLRDLAQRGINIFVTGLNQDFRGEPFSLMPRLLAEADEIIKLTAICNICGDEAHRTQRIIDGKPAGYNSPTVLVGAGFDSKKREYYEARCNKCHEVPGKK